MASANIKDLINRLATKCTALFGTINTQLDSFNSKAHITAQTGVLDPLKTYTLTPVDASGVEWKAKETVDYSTKVIYQAGQYVAFPTTFIPNQTLWEVAGTTAGETLVQGPSEGHAVGVVSVRNGRDNDYIKLVNSNYTVSVSPNNPNSILTNNTPDDFELTGTVKASGINVKWYKALKNITLGDL